MNDKPRYYAVWGSNDNAWELEYEESSNLRNVDGYMIVYDGGCSITLRSTLSATQKQAGLRGLLSRLSADMEPANRIMLWTLEDRVRASD